MTEICAIFGTKSIKCSPYHAAGNGLAEASNKAVIKILKHTVDKHQLNWDLMLPYSVFALNTSLRKSLKDSSFYLLFLTDARLPLDSVLELPRKQFENLPDYKEQAQFLFASAFESCRQSIETAQDVQKEYYDRKAVDQEYFKGDLVWVFTPALKAGTSKKLSKLYSGPYRVLSTDPPKVLLRPMHKRHSKPKWTHCSRIKPCYTDYVPPFTHKGENEPVVFEEMGTEDPKDQTLQKELETQNQTPTIKEQLNPKNPDLPKPNPKLSDRIKVNDESEQQKDHNVPVDTTHVLRPAKTLDKGTDRTNSSQQHRYMLRSAKLKPD